MNANGGIFYMKATGIVRRIDETAIIGPSRRKLVKWCATRQVDN